MISGRLQRFTSAKQPSQQTTKQTGVPLIALINPLKFKEISDSKKVQTRPSAMPSLRTQCMRLAMKEVSNNISPAIELFDGNDDRP